MTGIYQNQFDVALQSFFGKSTGAIVPVVGPELLGQFDTVGQLNQYRLPDGRLIWSAVDGLVEIYVVAVMADAHVPTVLAAAIMTNLCPKSGVDETMASSQGARYKSHFTCELDYSLIILYKAGSTPDPEINLDLTKWAKASLQTSQRVIAPADRKLLLKRFVRVLNDGAVDLSKVDDVFPLAVTHKSLF